MFVPGTSAKERAKNEALTHALSLLADIRLTGWREEQRKRAVEHLRKALDRTLPADPPRTIRSDTGRGFYCPQGVPDTHQPTAMHPRLDEDDDADEALDPC